VERIVISLKKKELDTIEALSRAYNIPTSIVFNLLIREGLKILKNQGCLKLHPNPRVLLKEESAV
jgi:hypothetical protein